MSDIAKLGLTVDEKGAVRALENFKGAVKQTTDTTAKQEAQLRSLAKWLQSGGAAHQSYADKIIRSNGGLQNFLRVQQQLEKEVKETTVAVEQQAVAVQRVDAAKKSATVSTDKLRGGFVALATQLTNTNPVIARLATTLGGFAVSSGIMIGILAGLSAVAFAYQKITEEGREAKKATDELIKSLAEKRRQEEGDSPAGRARTVGEAEAELARRREALRRVQLAGPDGTADIAGGADYGASREEVDRKIAEAQLAVRQAELDLQRIEVEGAKARWQSASDYWDREKSELAAQAERDKKAHAEWMARIKERVEALSRINVDVSAASANVAARAGALGGSAVYQDPAAETRMREQMAAENLRREQQQADDQERANKRFGESVTGMSEVMQIAAQTIEYAVVQKLGGGTMAGNLGASLGKSAAGSLINGNFSGAGLMNGAAGGVLGIAFAGIGAGLAQWADDLWDLSGAAKAAAEALKEQREALDRNLDRLEARARGEEGSLEFRIAEARKDFEDQMKVARNSAPKGERTWGLGDPGTWFFDERKRILALEEEYIAMLEEEQRVKNQQFGEDIEVRALRAQGFDEEADKLEQRLRHQREYDAAVKAGLDEMTLKRLLEVQAMEEASKAIEELTGALNLVSGYRYQRAIFGAMTPRDSWTPPPGNIPYNPAAPTGPLPDVVIPIHLDGQVITTVVHSGLKKKAQQRFGDSRRWPEVN